MNRRLALIAGLAPRLVEFVALVALGVILARLAWLVIEPAGAVSRVTPDVAGPVGSPALRGPLEADLSLLTRINAFAGRVAAPSDAVAEDAPETSLDLVLKGIRAVTGDGEATATIVTPDNRQSLFREGDEILRGVVISRILSDRIILDKDGTYESLFREGRSSALEVIGGAEPRQEIDGRVTVETGIYRVPGLPALWQAARLERAADGGGWRVRAAGDEASLARFGLADGDRVETVAGRQTAAMDYEDLTDLLGDGDRVELTVGRGGKSLRLTLVFEGE